MNRIFIMFLFIPIAAMVCISMAATGTSEASEPVTAPVQRLVINFNSHWLFTTGDVPDGEAETLTETGFQPVCLPHANATVPHRDIDTSSFRNISWYRRHLTPSTAYQGKRFILEFQGAAQVTKVFVNGKPVGVHRGAYTPFSFDITDQIRFGDDNVIAVRVDSRKHKEIPPEGGPIDYMLFGGITRDVSMIITSPLHIEWVFASRDSITPSLVNVRCRIRNNNTEQKDCVIESRIIDSTGKVVALGKGTVSVAPDSIRETGFITDTIRELHEWDIEHPYLYTIRTRVLIDSTAVDDFSEPIGLRSIAFSKSDGIFRLNGKPLRLNGLNRHETFPFIGRAAANRLQAKDAEILKYDLGCNIVRCSHYPQDPEFLRRCDEIGLLVLEEIPGWGFVGDSSWREITLKNVEEMIVRDRNHPSIISFGVRVNQSPDFHDLYVKTNRLARTLDPTRPTHGVRLKGRYSPNDYLEDIWTHNFIIPKEKPELLPWFITESFGVGCQVHSWDNQEKLVKVMLRFAEVMDSVAMNPYIAGQIGWCAFDYNSNHGTADRSVCYYGASDMYRIPKHAGMFLKSQSDPGKNGPMVYIAHTWKRKLTPNDVWVAGNCDQVELFVNNKSLGKRKPDKYPSLPHPLTVWRDVSFRPPGTIKAVGYIGDSAVVTHIRKTPGRTVAFKIIPDDTVLTEGGDMTRVVVLGVDRWGQTVPKAKNIVELSVSGAADFVGQKLIALEDGKTVFFVKTRADETGAVKCKAVSKGLMSGRTRLTVIGDAQAPLRKAVLGK